MIQKILGAMRQRQLMQPRPLAPAAPGAAPLPQHAVPPSPVVAAAPTAPAAAGYHAAGVAPAINIAAAAPGGTLAPAAPEGYHASGVAPLVSTAPPTAPVTGDPAAPAGTMAIGDAAAPFVPGSSNDYRTAVITPGSSAAQRARELMQQNLEGINGPGADRQALAQHALERFDADNGQQTDALLRKVRQTAGATGRIGAGMTTSAAGDVGTEAIKARERFKAELADKVSGQTMQDQLDRLGATSRAGAQFRGEDLDSANWTRGEREYQTGRSDVAQGRQQEAYQRQMQLIQMLLAAANGGDPTSALMAAGQGGGGVDLSALFANAGRTAGAR